MALIFEKKLNKIDKERGMKVTNGASLLPSYDAILDVVNGSTGNVVYLDYKVSGRDVPIIRGSVWHNFIRLYRDGATITLYAYQGSEALQNCSEIERLNNPTAVAGSTSPSVIVSQSLW